MFKQISEYFEPILSKFQRGFRKGFSAQHCLLAMLEKWKAAVDNKKNIWCTSHRFVQSFRLPSS